MKEGLQNINKISFDTVSDDHVFSREFEERQKRIIETMKEEERVMNRKNWKAAAAAFVLIFGLSGGMVGASQLMKVENMLIGEESASTTKEPASETEKNTGEQSVMEYETDTNLIALGIPESNEWKGSQEWEWFCERYERSYDYEEAVLMADEASKSSAYVDAYAGYPAYYGIVNQEMADKLDEICEKYNLELPGDSQDVFSYEELLKAAQVESFISGKVELLEGSVDIAGGGWNMDFNLSDDDNHSLCEWGYISYHKKGVLASVLNLGDLSDYEEWNYTNAGGEELVLVMNHVTGKSYIFYEADGDFVTVSLEPAYTYYFEDEVVDDLKTDMWTRYETTPLSKEQLQLVADSIQFSKITAAK